MKNDRNDRCLLLVRLSTLGLVYFTSNPAPSNAVLSTQLHMENYINISIVRLIHIVSNRACLIG